eukprot:CAMPEP_0172463652 /NCGR_PEP_ID=MMETSP1065-20121228/47990_1 /TAXON_ID=265537 /ORGANISM="Amphiprora paludosa, Strain CCMP125" /LENGTH=38 /DNA_ID= /DNA_START= /DNA_END= /DNA_ORIENTATION=
MSVAKTRDTKRHLRDHRCGTVSPRSNKEGCMIARGNTE